MQSNNTSAPGIYLSLIILFCFPATALALSLPDQEQCRKLWQESTPIKPEVNGWCLFIDQRKGNCIACHHVETNNWPDSLPPAGNIGPILPRTQAAYSDRTELEKVIYDISFRFPDSIMPRYGTHLILSEKEIDLIARFLLSQ